MDEREENERDARKDEGAFPDPPRRFNPSETVTREHFLTVQAMTTELQNRIVTARQYAIRHGSDPALLAILAGQADE